MGIIHTQINYEIVKLKNLHKYNHVSKRTITNLKYISIIYPCMFTSICALIL